MCGINGINWKDESTVLRMNEVTKHRGPDATGIYSDDFVTLGNNRLSIIDLDERSNQPMIDNSGNLVIVYNGEIYNFLDIKKELEGGYDFKTKSDTEVILASYKKWGKAGFKKLNGMFSFALWDKNTKEFILARDPVGIKPLYYFFDGQKLIFSSEIKGILEHADVPRKLNRDAFSAFMRVLYVPSPMTAFENINKLPQGHFLSYKDGKIEIHKYHDWSENIPENKDSLVEEVRKKVQASVERQLVSDKPIGLYLSGGLDSTSVLNAMSKTETHIESFSVGFNLPNKKDEEKFNADFMLAREVSKIYGTKHNELLITPKDVLDNAEFVISNTDDLISNPTSIPMYLLAKFTKNKVAVALSGDGGDEVFGGYDRYRYAREADIYQKLPVFLRKFQFTDIQKKLETPAGIKLFSLFMFQKDKALENILEKEFFQPVESTEKIFEKEIFSELKNLSGADQLIRADFSSWLPDQALALADKVSMAGSLEQRVPLLDLEIVSLLYNLPAKDKLSLRQNKVLLREAFKKELPPFLFKQPKRGWFAPGAKWLRDPDFLQFVKAVLNESYYVGTSKMFNWKEVEKMLDDHVSGKVYNVNSLWAILTFQIWAQKYKVIL
ncbi:asparagine synthase (glutamine-hydrolyzing) [Candidatus Campbellbacteria bacterium CG22_combo_CG10-13_8_21_14_all_36_13]|uniref:asparagine synthase (glutamine-hydrolyzing) n=1 Tax=Candidatus Campbellbacteria bacterium CG22_combo_CG10-13_8_21_14_all_36_13 TaxID=1974529 RepID=A0A2H0DXC8_9BACT|nr:MAG: asparagine synthase (glutamine-hydrolyzing) [Candidatus Campbellbacteria bacterium CG22_combo_CG10-13_8_21_14_all_36_13]